MQTVCSTVGCRDVFCLLTIILRVNYDSLASVADYFVFGLIYYALVLSGVICVLYTDTGSVACKTTEIVKFVKVTDYYNLILTFLYLLCYTRFLIYNCIICFNKYRTRII